MTTRATFVMIVLAVAVATLPANADSYRIFGTITTDAGAPISGVRVSVSGADEVAMTDSRGEYEVTDVPADTTCAVKPSHPDYSFKPESREVTITSGDEWVNFAATDAQVSIRGVATDGTSGDRPVALATKGPRVTYPSAAGITWLRGHEYTITWEGFASANVRIQVWKNWTLTDTLVASTPNDGSYTATVPLDAELGDDYLIRVSETGTSWRPDFSNHPFTIADSVTTPKVTYPSAAGVVWTRGDAYTITWQGFATANVRIQLWKNWALVSTITTGTPNDGSFTWTVPTGTALGSDYLIRVSETGASWRPDFSNHPFTIIAPAVPKVTYPNAAGITWIRGQDYTITWEGFASANVRIQVWKNWTLADTLTTGTPNDGSYTVTIPLDAELGDDYLIRVSETGTSWRPDFSNHEFTIADAGGGEITRRAVCVGISDYVGTSSDLNYCDDDARDFAAALAAGGNWDAGNITTLLDRNATAANIWAALNAMSAASDSNDQCVFFFSGHGGWATDQAPIDEPNGRDEYLCETNFADNIYDDALGQWVTDLPTTNVFVVLCSCFSGGFIKGENSVKCISGPQPDGGGGFAAEIQAAMDAKFHALKDIDDAAAGVTLTAADYNETCQESSVLQHDVFNHYVLQAMGGAGDANSDGTITAEEIYAYAAPLATSFNPGQHAQIYDAAPGQGFVVLY